MWFRVTFQKGMVNFFSDTGYPIYRGFYDENRIVMVLNIMKVT